MAGGFGALFLLLMVYGKVHAEFKIKIGSCVAQWPTIVDFD